MLERELEQLLNSSEQFKEIWLDGQNGESLCALINGNIGWLMYSRFEGDAGFATKNPQISSNKDVEYVLNNGQKDWYPENWTYSVKILAQAMQSFLRNNQQPSQVDWQDNST